MALSVGVGWGCLNIFKYMLRTLKVEKMELKIRLKQTDYISVHEYEQKKNTEAVALWISQTQKWRYEKILHNTYYDVWRKDNFCDILFASFNDKDASEKLDLYENNSFFFWKWIYSSLILFTRLSNRH